MQEPCSRPTCPPILNGRQSVSQSSSRLHHQLESRMREIRPSGLEGGGTELNRFSLPPIINWSQKSNTLSKFSSRSLESANISPGGRPTFFLPYPCHPCDPWYRPSLGCGRRPRWAFSWFGPNCTGRDTFSGPFSFFLVIIEPVRSSLL